MRGAHEIVSVASGVAEPAHEATGLECCDLVFFGELVAQDLTRAAGDKRSVYMFSAMAADTSRLMSLRKSLTLRISGKKAGSALAGPLCHRKLIDSTIRLPTRGRGRRNKRSRPSNHLAEPHKINKLRNFVFNALIPP